MCEKNIDVMSDGTLAPISFVELMFERTDEDGIVYIPGWHYPRPGWSFNAPGSTDENDSYRCKIRWNIAKYEKVKADFEKLFNSIKEIATHYDELYFENLDATKVLKCKELLDVWNTYLKPLDISGFDPDKYDDIYEKLDTIAWVKSIAAKVTNGEKIEDYEKEVLNDNIDLTVTQDETIYHQRYLNNLYKQAEKRIGDNICAYDVILRAWRLCRLFSLGAPQLIINNEGKQLAAAFVLHACGISRELVGNAVRLRIEEMEQMSEEELDAISRPQKTNTRKSLAPLFVYEILKKYSDSKHHLRYNDIIEKLREYPYEVSLERKAISRIIHGLIDSPQYAIFQDGNGSWVEQEEQKS